MDVLIYLFSTVEEKWIGHHLLYSTVFVNDLVRLTLLFGLFLSCSNLFQTFKSLGGCIAVRIYVYCFHQLSHFSYSLIFLGMS